MSMKVPAPLGRLVGRLPVRAIAAVALAALGLAGFPWLVVRARASSQRLQVLKVPVEVPESAPFDGHLDVLTWNIAHGRGLAKTNWTGESDAARDLRLDSIAETLRAEGADVVVLNEVDFDSSWSRGVDQAQAIAERAGYPFVVEVRNLDTAAGPYRWAFGNAVLSRLPLEAAEVVDLPGHSALETAVAGKKRGLAVDVVVDGHRRARLIAAHLEHRLEAVRVLGAREVLRHAADAAGSPVIVAGDLNSAPSGDFAHKVDAQGDNALEVLLAEGRLTGGRAGRTFPADRPRAVIDWILVSEELALRRYEVIPSMDSDHRPVLARVAFLPQGAGDSPPEGASAMAEPAAGARLAGQSEAEAEPAPVGRILAFDHAPRPAK